MFLLTDFTGEGEGGLNLDDILAFADLASQGGVVVANLISVFYPLNQTFLVNLVATST